MDKEAEIVGDKIINDIIGKYTEQLGNQNHLKVKRRNQVINMNVRRRSKENLHDNKPNDNEKANDTQESIEGLREEEGDKVKLPKKEEKKYADNSVDKTQENSLRLSALEKSSFLKDAM